MYKEIYFAGGCFWGVEKYFASIDGVVETEVGYANGRTQRPTYEQVCREGTGHAETVKVVYDPDTVSLPFLLELFYEIIDPTAKNRQGPDVGEQYRCGVYYVRDEDKRVIEHSVNALQTRYDRPLALEVKPLAQYFPAEEAHQEYLDKHPGGYCHIPAAAFSRARAAKEQPAYRRRSTEALRGELTDLQYKVTQENATEPPFRNEYWDTFRPGIYVDITTGEPLFISSDKFDAGCGWPSFSRPLSDALIEEKPDFSLGARRTEVRSKTGDAHLGHVFEDGPAEQGGLRYCINSAALRFIPREQMADAGYAAYLDLVDE